MHMKHLVLLLLSIISFAINAQSGHSLYLSPTGNDLAKGSREAPLQSLTGARDLIRKIPGNDTVYVNIAAGDYFMKEPLELTPKDKHPIVFRSQSSEKPVFYGGIAVSGWEKGEHGIWKTKVREVQRYRLNAEQFYVNDRRAVRARTPNKEWFKVLGSSEMVHEKGKDRGANFATQRFVVNPKDIRSLSNLTVEESRDVLATFYHKWDVTTKAIHHLVIDSGFIFTNGKGMKSYNQIENGSRYTLENYKAALDTCGEWFLSRNGDLFYMPRKDENMETAIGYIPVNHQFVVIKGSQEASVSAKSFHNLSFKVAAYEMPSFGKDPVQAAADVEAAVMIDFARNIEFSDCEIAHTGSYAMWFRQECFDSSVDHCHLYDLGSGGIKIGEPYIRLNSRKVTNNITINNNIIQHAGYILPVGVGVAILFASDNKIIHNEISDLRYSGVSVGWIWGYDGKPAYTTIMNDDGKTSMQEITIINPTVRNTIAYNHIHHIGWGELSDMGAVYTLGNSTGTKIVNNVIHDVYSYDYGGWGLYTDEGSTDVVMENNLVYGCKSGGFHQHYGKNNKICNNIFAFGQYQQLQFTRVEDHKSFDFKHNIVLADCGSMISGDWKNAKIDMDDNCYWDLRTDAVMFNDLPFSKWKKIKDAHSVIADPQFVNPVLGDYKFKNSRIANKIGFKPFDYTKAGVNGSPEWKKMSILDQGIIDSFESIIRKREKAFSRIYKK
jgi:hypothetical protein